MTAASSLGLELEGEPTIASLKLESREDANVDRMIALNPLGLARVTEVGTRSPRHPHQ